MIPPDNNTIEAIFSNMEIMTERVMHSLYVMEDLTQRIDNIDQSFKQISAWM